MNKNIQLLILGLFSLSSSACIKTLALNATADALTSQGGGFGTDDDPKLIEKAAPFGLKTMENLAESLPKHQRLRFALASGFTQYAYAFVQPEVNEIVDKSVGEDAQEAKIRIQRLFVRARGYALDGLELRHKGTKQALLGTDQLQWKLQLAQMKKDDVPYLYWCGAAWALLISNSRTDPYLVSQLSVVDKIIKRGYELDESYDEGAFHEYFLANLSGTSPEAIKQADFHKNRVLELSGKRKLGVLVSYAINIVVPQKDKKQFEELLNQVINTDIDSEDPLWRKNRLANFLAQQQARKLLTKLSDYFN